MSRFGSFSIDDIDKVAQNSIPVNTMKSRKSVWLQFRQFCHDKGHSFEDVKCSNEKLNDILKDWAFNMKKANGEDYKESVVKVMWNCTAKQLQELYYEKWGTKIDPFRGLEFSTSRRARDSKRRVLQAMPEKRKESATALTYKEYQTIISYWREDTPVGLQRKFYHIAAVELAWRGGEASNLLVSHFRKEIHNDGTFTG